MLPLGYRHSRGWGRNQQLVSKPWGCMSDSTVRRLQEKRTHFRQNMGRWNSRIIALAIHLEESKPRQQTHGRELGALLLNNPLEHYDDNTDKNAP